MTKEIAEAKMFRYGWYGDGGLGEAMIRMILAGRKTATASPAYDSKAADRVPGDELSLVDKHGRIRGRVLVTAVETLPLSEFDEALASELGLPLADALEKLAFANGRRLRDDEEMRVVRFRLISPPLPPR